MMQNQYMDFKIVVKFFCMFLEVHPLWDKAGRGGRLERGGGQVVMAQITPDFRVRMTVFVILKHSRTLQRSS